MNNKGQITVEYMLMVAVIIIIMISATNVIQEETEKNTILNAAQIGAQIGVDKNGYAMYYNDTFNNYQENYQRLLYPTDIEVINITLTKSDKNIYLQVNLHTNNDLTTQERYIIGYRVNYYVRKTIAETFNQNITYPYENLETERFKIRNNTVKWV
ncbi:MAG: hypothetical protein BZ135_04470 [Methanosphaera sp. rholeuAM6]|nr:MAG: hypothetical protein BZ135_04470 [Methanosphaera sp. rholeuAM6]